MVCLWFIVLPELIKHRRRCRCRTKCQSWCRNVQCSQISRPCCYFLWQMSLCRCVWKVVCDCIRVYVCCCCSSKPVVCFFNLMGRSQASSPYLTPFISFCFKNYYDNVCEHVYIRKRSSLWQLPELFALSALMMMMIVPVAASKRQIPIRCNGQIICCCGVHSLLYRLPTEILETV